MPREGIGAAVRADGDSSVFGAPCTRRDFVKQGSAAVLLALALGPTAEAFADEQAKAYTAKDFKDTYDVVVVGSGLAATTAALVAAQKGGKVLMMEKTDVLGGNSARRGFRFACVGSDEQKEQGLEDSADKLVEDVRKISEDYGHRALLQKALERNGECYRMLKDAGVSFEGLVHLRGHSVDRVLSAGDGKRVMDALHAKLDGSVVVQTNAQATALVVEDGRTVRGVVATVEGEERAIGARKGVILATGSYAADAQFLKAEAAYLEDVVAGSDQVNPGATAELLKAMSKNDGQLVNMSLYHFDYPIYERDFYFGMMVDRQGARFADEGNPNKFGRAACKLKKKQGAAPLAVFDQAGFDNITDTARRDRALEDKRLVKYESLEELAAGCNLPADALAQTAKAYGEAIAAGKDAAFSKSLAGLQGAGAESAPFYAIEVDPTVSYTVGGLKVNEDAQVMRLSDGTPFVGLYAAGEVTGGVQGAQLLEGVYAAECMAFGMIAAEKASETKAN